MTGLRERQKAHRHDRILDAATAEFSARGIAGARVDRIADAAACNKALLYSYFGNKDQLFDANKVYVPGFTAGQ